MHLQPPPCAAPPVRCSPGRTGYSPLCMQLQPPAHGLQVRSEFHDATVITIAHRLNSVLDADKILVLDDGQLVELGTPKELMARSGGRFRSLVNAEHS